MSTTLYRKYRPQRFADLTGQRHIQVTLTNELKSGRIAHAYLFTGPRGVGKTTVARLLAKAVNCAQRDGAEPDNRCPACVEITEGRALDVLEIDAASQTGVDHVRENIIANARVAPAQLRYKVFIIDEVHMLSIGAFNALLKILEEPPSHALFVLATTEVHKVPETIISRCQRFDFHRVSVDDLKARLTTLARAEGVAVADAVLDEVARRAEGSVRDADSLLGQLVALGEPNVTEDLAAIVLPRADAQSVAAFFESFVRQDRASALGKLHELIDEGISLPQFARQFVELLRGLMLLKTNPTVARSALATLDAKQEAALAAAAADVPIRRLIDWLALFHDVERQVKLDPLPQLPIELAILQALPEPTDAEPPTPATRTMSTAAPSSHRPSRQQPMKPSMRKSSAIAEVADVEKSWSRLLQAVKKLNHGITFILKTAVPVAVEDGCLVIGVRFPFHAERLMEPKNRQQLEAALEEVVGQPLTIRCSVVPATAGPEDPIVGDVAKAFGGEVL